MRRVNELKILILTAATGGGHLKAAHTLQTYIQENTQDNEVVVADTLKEVSAILDKTCCDGYRFLARRTPRVFGRLYRASNSDTPLYSLVERFNGAIGRKLLPLFETEKPDVVISTHPFATEMGVAPERPRPRARAAAVPHDGLRPAPRLGGAECGRLCRGG